MASGLPSKEAVRLFFPLVVCVSLQSSLAGQSANGQAGAHGVDVK